MSRLRYWLPPVLFAGLMWGLSTDTFSSQHTGSAILPMLRWLLPHASAATIEAIHTLIRKSAHVGEYFIFSLLLFRAVRSGRPGWKTEWAVAAVAIAAAYGALDETHQIFVPSRGPSVVDVMIDTSGATLAQIVAWLWNRTSLHAARDTPPGQP